MNTCRAALEQQWGRRLSDEEIAGLNLLWAKAFARARQAGYAAVASPEIRAAVDATGVSWLIAVFALAALAGTGWLVWQRVKQAKLEA